MPKSEIIKKSLSKIETKPGKEYNFYEDVVMREINQDISRIPELYAFWAIAAEEALKNYELADIQFDNFEANLEKSIRRKALKHEEKLTDSLIRNKLKVDVEWLKAKREVIEKKAIANKLKAGAKALMIKADLLRTKAANKRQSLMPDSVMKYKRKTLSEEE